MYYLGVDGGGTKTDFILITKKGQILSYFRTGTCHYKEIGLERFEKVIKEGIRKVTGEAGLEAEDISFAFLGIPCYGEFKEDIPVLKGIISSVLGEDFKCGNDVEAAWAGSLACKPGINIVAGTGAIGFGRDPDGNSARASGWGYFCGDEGSGYWLGKKLISLFTKEADGRIEKTVLYHLIRDEFSLEDDFDFISVVHDELELKRSKIARLAVILDRAADQGDQKALELFDQAAYEHSLTAAALRDKLNFAGPDQLPVSYSGGVFKAGEYILDPLRNYLHKKNMVLKKPELSPAVGAVFYALQLDSKSSADSQQLHKIKNTLQKEQEKFIN